jgi:hypothetical protein
MPSLHYTQFVNETGDMPVTRRRHGLDSGFAERQPGTETPRTMAHSPESDPAREGRGRLLTIAAELLGRAHRYVRMGWCQGADATDASGHPVEPWSSEATHWSLLGAIVAALDRRDPRPAGELPLSALATAMGALADLIYEPSLARWNDDPLRSQQEVLAVLERARTLCLSGGHDRVEPEPLP